MTLKDELNAYKLVAKRILKSVLSRNPETLARYVNDIVNAHNRFVRYVNGKFGNASSQSKLLYESTLGKVIIKTGSCFTRLKLRYDFSESLFDYIDEANLIPFHAVDDNSEEESEESQSSDETQDDNVIMTQTKEEFLVYASKLIPEFDGQYANLESFCDALTLVDASVGAHVAHAVALAKTKLKNDSRMYITNEATLQAIINTLKNEIKPDSTSVITSKLMNVSQAKKKANDYVKEIESLAADLKRAYITDGLPLSVATSYATKAAVEAMQKNASNDKVKLVMEAGNFSNLNDAVSKFVSTSNNEAATNNTIHFMRRGQSSNYRGKRGGFRNYRGSNGYRFNQNRSQNRQNNYQNGNNNSRQFTYSRNNNRGRNGNQVRVVQVDREEGQGNSQPPQSIRLRDA
mgnify:CR=1 FL=1